MTFAPHPIFCEDCHRLTPADDVERRPHGTVLIAECRCGHVVSRVFPTLLSRASSRPPARDGASRANRPSRLRKEPLPDPIAEQDRLGVEAYVEARHRERDVILPDVTTHAGRTPAHWRQVALIVSRLTGKRVGVDTATRMGE